MNFQKIIRNYWFWIALVIILILLGVITINISFETFTSDIMDDQHPWSSCPQTQDCSAKGVVHKCNEKALDIAKTQYVDEINKLNKEIDGSNIQIGELESKLADIQNNVIDGKNENKSLLTKFDQLETSYSNLNKKLNYTKELLKEEQDKAKKNIYTQIPNFSCNSCPQYKSFKTTLDQCKNECDKTNQCKLINYYPPTQECHLKSELDYEKMARSSWDMYLKNTPNGTIFNINDIKKTPPKPPNINQIVANKFTSVPNTDFPGDDLGFTADACKAACLAIDGCETVTVDKDKMNRIGGGNGCWPKRKNKKEVSRTTANSYLLNK